MITQHNKTIAWLSLETPSGCMGECSWFSMRASLTGALEYRGIANVELIGERKGLVNFYEFDLIASVVETSGFLNLSDHDDGGCSSSTVGDTTIGVGFLNGQDRILTRDALDEPPLFWAVAKLIGTLLEKAEWGDDVYRHAVAAFANRDLQVAMSTLQRCISALFEAEDQESASSMLNALSVDPREDPLRIRLAAVRYSGGSLERLRIGLEMCRRDYRDLLRNAGFGADIHAHFAWIPRRFRKSDAANWLNGDRIDGVDFHPDEEVWKLTMVQRRKKDAQIMSLAGLEPTVTYVVRYPSGKEELVAQEHLVKRESTEL